MNKGILLEVGFMRINPVYLEMQDKIKNTELPLLYDFLLNPDKLKKDIEKLGFVENYDCLKQRFSEAVWEAPKELVNFSEAITGKKVIGCKVLRLLWKDYQILNDTVEKVNEVVIDLTESWPENAGGSLSYDGVEIPIGWNTLFVGEGRRSIKYCNHYSELRFLIILQMGDQ